MKLQDSKCWSLEFRFPVVLNLSMQRKMIEDTVLTRTQTAMALDLSIMDIFGPEFLEKKRWIGITLLILG